MTGHEEILVLSSTAEPRSGWGSMTYHLARELERRGRSVTVVLPRGASAPAGIDARAVLPRWRPSFGPRPHLGLLHALVGSRLGPGLRHVVAEYPYAITATAGRRRGPVIVSGQGTYLVAPLERPADRRWHRRALLRADVVTVPSRYTLDRLRGLVPELRDVRVVPNPVDVEWLLEPTPVVDGRAALGVPPAAPLVLSFAALKPRKGVDVLLRAFARTRDAQPDAVLAVVGAGDPSATARLAGELGIADAVRLPGPVDAATLRALYRDCDVFALLPRVVGPVFEGFGLVYLEAGAFGKPVVGTRSGGVPDAVDDGVTGFLVEEDDPAAAGDALLRLLGDPVLRDRMGQAGRRRAAGLSWSRHVTTIVDLYDELRERGPADLGRGR
ncbi:MAG TPA: glycosyltransferase family 4 protein [Acidimicrobiales bacterium]|nr:glycosyltransferase family 4 protein [Acidimicrobiales bacterium]